MDNDQPKQDEDDDGTDDDDVSGDQEFIKVTDDIMERWERDQPEELRIATIDQYVETGMIDFEEAGIKPAEAMVIEHGYTLHLSASVLEPLGLTYDQWNSYVDDGDLAAFRRAAVQGEWNVFRDHA